MDLSDKGLYNVVLNDVRLIHHESVSRGRDDASDARAERLKKERELFYSKHPALLKRGDVFYNRALTSLRLDYSADYALPWEEEVMDVPLKERHADLRLRTCPKDRFLWSIDRVDYVPSLFDAEPFWEIEGWCIKKGSDMSRLEPGVYITPGPKTGQDGAVTHMYTAARKLRPELAEVFPKERNVLLSGFIARIPASLFPARTPKEHIRPVLIKEGLFGKTVFSIKD